MASPHHQESNQVSDDKHNPDYTEASSLPISEDSSSASPDYVDAASAPVAADKEEAGEDDSASASSSGSSFVDARSGHTLTRQGCGGDPSYVDAFSADDAFCDAQEKHETQGSSEGADVSGNSEELQSSGDHNQQGDRHVYFELEKMNNTDDSEESTLCAPSVKGNTIVKAKVKVAERAKLFQGTDSYPYSQPKPKDRGGQDVTYDVPPARQTETTSLCVTDNSTVPREEDIYEISPTGEPRNQSNDFQSSLEGSGMYEKVRDPSEVRAKSPKPTVYELARPVEKPSQRSSLTLPATDLSSSGGFIACKQGSVQQGQVQTMVPSQEEIETEYNRLQFHRTSESKPKAGDAQYSSLEQVARNSRDPTTNEPLYDSPQSFSQHQRSWEADDWSDGSWGSSEFEEYEDDEGYEAEPDTPAPMKPLPRKPRHHESFESVPKIPALLLQKLKSPNTKSPVVEDSDTVCLPVTINTSKHPPPELPPAPEGLTEQQRKRRMVVELTINSERSYIESLERIVQEYEKPITEVIPGPKSHVRAVFREAKEILNHHKMFQIELADTVKKWDAEEKIGDIFTASFSKSMLVDAYSVYVNNFAAGMDEIRTVQQNRPSFEEFLKMKEKSSYDRLSIFGLMVKPIQRFPQFIMLIQDLIKYMPHSHHDRRALQLALTELENVTHKLNERKRLSEQYFQAKQTMQLLPRQLPSHVLSSRNMEKQRRLIRFDNFDQIDGEMENMKSSSRRLILMDDMLVCVKVGLKDQDGFMMERYRLKWALRLCDVELKDAAMTPDMRNVVKMDSNRLRAISAQLEKHEEDPFHLYADLRDMLHDLTVFGQICGLMKSLRRTYQGYNMSEELFHEVTADLQRMIQIKDEQLRLVNSCSIILVDGSKADKPHYVMQTPTAAMKSEWCVDFNMAKLAIEKQNRPGWDRSPLAGNDELEPAPALFMKCVPVDVPRHFVKVKCATPIFMPSVPHVNGGLGVQHLWVCSSSSARGQVSIVSLHNTRPALTESFKACECDLLCAEVVSGCGVKTHQSKYLFSEDTVWMANTHNEIVIFPLSSGGGGGSTATREPLAVLRVPGRVTSIKFVDERLFCGLDDGAVLVYSRNDVGEWCIKAGRTLELGRGPVRNQLVIDDNLWIACGHRVHVVEIDSLKILAVHTLSGDHKMSILQMVRSGVGVWVAFHNSAAVRLFHLETMENLQEMSVANTINRVLAEKSGTAETRDCVVTCIAASTGLLWIGTSVGLILTLPLPRLSDGVPLYSGRPSVSYHAHRSPVRFIIPVYCSGSVLELHRNSSLRSHLRARPSIRNLKREQLELKGFAEEKLLSSGTELEASHPPMKEGPSLAPNRAPRPAKVPEKMTDSVMKSQAGKKFFGMRRGKEGRVRDSRSSTLKPSRRVAKPVGRNRGSTLSFRSELANRIKRKSLGRFQAQSMFDLRSDDALEVEMLYENLLDSGGVSEEDDDSVINEDLDDMSIRSDSAMVDNSAAASQERADLAGLSMDSAKPPAKSSVSPTSSGSVTSEASTESKSHTKADSSEPTSQLGQSDDLPPRAPSPRIATIRAHTMRKTSASNAVMVLAGGDGYWDMHMGGNFSKNEEASLLFWIYKF